MISTGFKRRKVDLDFYLHRVFRKQSFRCVLTLKPSEEHYIDIPTAPFNVKSYQQLLKDMMSFYRLRLLSERACAFSYLL